MATQHFTLVPAVYVMLRRGNHILLVHRAHTDWMDNYWGLVAGHVEAGEMATAAMVREAKEEAGVTLDPADLQFVHLMQRSKQDNQPNSERIDIFFTTNKWQGELQNAEPDKHAEVKWFPIDQLPENTIPSIKHVIEHVQAGKTFSEFIGN